MSGTAGESGSARSAAVFLPIGVPRLSIVA